VAELDLSEGQTVLVNVDSLDGSGSYSLTVDRVDATTEPMPGSSDGSCCSPQLSGGCANETISACVCAIDDYCCADAWDELCVDAVAILGCGGCEAE
jgi:hypothetical protein